MIRRRVFLRTAPPLAVLAGCATDPAPERVAAAHGPDEGGIGGTGIFGVVIRRGSLVVNGLTLAVDTTTRVETLDGVGSALPGDAVAVHAIAAGRSLAAVRVAVFHPLIGPLAIDARGAASVLGTPVLLTADTVLRNPAGGILPRSALRSMRHVAVTGLWRDDAVEASALTPLPADGRVLLRGLLRRRDGALVIGRTRLPNPVAGFDALAETFVAVHGRVGDAGVELDAVTAEPAPLLSPAVPRLAVEGFVAPNRDGAGFHLAGFGLPLTWPDAALPPVGQRALLLGRYADALAVQAAISLPPVADARESVLRSERVADALRRWRRG